MEDSGGGSYQKDAPSSSENNTPPMGAPNAAATPAAAPHTMKSRFSRSLRKSCTGNGQHSHVEDKRISRQCTEGERRWRKEGERGGDGDGDSDSDSVR